MKQLFLFLILLNWATASPAQRLGSSTSSASAAGGGGETPPAPPARWQQHADSLFQFIDRTPVSTGLLANYGVAFKDCAPFQGTALSSANRLQHLGEWRLLYGAMQTSVFNANATLLPLLTLYPNPARETVDVHLDNPAAGQPGPEARAIAD